MDDMPIELRRLEDTTLTLSKQSESLSIKSKSLGDILEIQRLDLVRSRSSIPGLCSTVNSNLQLDDDSLSSSLSTSKPKLVKQKTHFNEDEDCLDFPENTAIEQIIKDLPDIQVCNSVSFKKNLQIKINHKSLILLSFWRKEKNFSSHFNFFDQSQFLPRLLFRAFRS